MSRVNRMRVSRVRRIAAAVAVVALATPSFGLRAEAAAAPAQPTAEPFENVQFNICSRICSFGTPPPGGAYTDWGLIPVRELLDVVAARGWPRVISLNEVCGQAAFVMATSLPAGLYDASFYVSARRPPDCDLYGNWVAVRTDDVPASEESEFHFSWGGGAPPPKDTESEHRGGACLRSFLAAERTWGCSTHLDADAGKADDLLRGVDTWLGTSAQVVLGDFNFEPGDAPTAGWADDNRHDIFEGVSPTYEGTNTHIDYGWIDLGTLEDASRTFSFPSTSDHRQLWGSARPR